LFHFWRRLSKIAGVKLGMPKVFQLERDGPREHTNETVSASGIILPGIRREFQDVVEIFSILFCVKGAGGRSPTLMLG